MSNGRGEPGRKGKKNPKDRDGHRFALIPHAVLESNAYLGLSHPARSLLLEAVMQLVADNNGRLLLTRAYLATRGWKSADVIQRAKQELLDGGFIFETVKGQRPNKASWYAVTWRSLDRHPDYDPGAVGGFPRSAYLLAGGVKNAALIPPHGTERRFTVPSRGTGRPSPVPSHGPMAGISGPSPVPSDGHHLDMPSTQGKKKHSTAGTEPTGAAQANPGRSVEVEG
jgi:hypothetical protein